MALRILKFRLMESTPGTDGSASSPSTPTPSAPSSPSSTSSDSSGAEFDFAGLAVHDDSDVASPSSEGGAAVAAPTGTPAQPTSVAPQPGVAPAVPPAAPAAAAPPSPLAQVTPPVPQGQPPGQSPAAAPQGAPSAAQPPATPTREQVSQTFAQHREKFIPELIKLYAFDPTRDAAAIEELRTDPATALPKLAANLHYEVQLSTYNSVMQAIPEVIGTILDRRMEVDNLTRQFKEMWPQLHEKPEYEAAAESSIRAMRAANPNMAMKDILQRAGMMAMLTLGLPLPTPAGAAPVAPVPGAAPAAPPVRMPPPGRPAGVGTAGPTPTVPPAAGGEGNIFEDLFDAARRGEI